MTAKIHSECTDMYWISLYTNHKV